MQKGWQSRVFRLGHERSARREEEEEEEKEEKEEKEEQEEGRGGEEQEEDLDMRGQLAEKEDGGSSTARSTQYLQLNYYMVVQISNIQNLHTCTRRAFAEEEISLDGMGGWKGACERGKCVKQTSLLLLQYGNGNTPDSVFVIQVSEGLDN